MTAPALKAPATMGARLRQAIKQWRTGSIREFQREMKARGAPRSTYPTINGYLKDETEPPPSFFTEAAALLNVRREWLTFGTGQQTEQEEQTQSALEGVTENVGDIEVMCAQICDVREQSEKLKSIAGEIEVRILGPVPSEEAQEVPIPSVSCLTGVVGTTTREIRDNLREASGSLDRIYRELGSIGKG